MIIRQCIPADRAQAAAFAQSAMADAAGTHELADFALDLSLIAAEGSTTLGVALCRLHPTGATHELVVVAADQNDLAQAMVDKAVNKLRAKGIHQCRVTVLRGGEPLALWSQARWSGTEASPRAN